MLEDKKYLAIGLLLLTIILVIFLASGISGVEFQPGTLLAKEGTDSDPVPFIFPAFSTPIWYYLLMCTIWVILPVSVFLFIKFPEVRKRTRQYLVYVALYGLILFLLTRKTQDDSLETEEIENELIDRTIIDTQREAAQFISSVTETDQNLSFVLDILLLVLISLLLWYLLRRFFLSPHSTTDRIKSEVVSAINEIKSGADLHNVIIRCYADLCQILIDSRGIQRQLGMTPREFEFELQDIGLPANEVHRLTRLFEAARYGNFQPDKKAEQEAIHCLTIIAEAC